MTEGSGPGRGVPWWRWRRVVWVRKVHGLTECDPAQREGRLIKKVR